MTAAYGTYEFFVDWDNDGGLRADDFEVSFDTWEEFGTTPPELELSTAQAYSGDQSLKITWVEYNPFTFNDADAGFDEGAFGVAGFENLDNVFTFNDADKGFDEGAFGWVSTNGEVVNPYLTRNFENLTVGKLYTLSMWVYVPSAGGQHITATINGVSATSSTTNAWQELTMQFVANAEEHELKVDYSGTLVDGDVTYLDYIFMTAQFENITERVREGVSFGYGHDNSRMLDPYSGAECDLDLGNVDSRFSPNNPHSIVAGNIQPGREVLVRCVYSGKAYDLLRGFLDNLSEDPSTDERSVTIEVVDALAFLAETRLSTSVYPGLRTGDAVNTILDAINWPEHKRDIDSGATVIQYWWEEDTTVTQALEKIVLSEGAPAYCTISPGGNFVFKDRHHRLFQAGSLTSTATFHASDTEPMFSAPMDIDLGWKDIINVVELNVTQYRTDYVPEDATSQDGNEEGLTRDRPGGLKPPVWQYPEVFSISSGETRTFKVVSDDPFIHAEVPDGSLTGLADSYNDYKVISGSISVSLDRTSGQSCNIVVAAISGPATVKGMQLRAVPLTAMDDMKVSLRDTTSIERVGKEVSHNVETPWANLNDATDIGRTILGHRAHKTPTVSITVNNGSVERLTQILERDLSDRITIVEPRSYTNAEYYIEHIEHDISTVGFYHETTFSCEQVPTYTDDSGNTTTPFTFNDADAGFDEGVFGYDGLSEPGTVFVLDESLLDEGMLSY